MAPVFRLIQDLVGHRPRRHKAFYQSGDLYAGRDFPLRHRLFDQSWRQGRRVEIVRRFARAFRYSVFGIVMDNFNIVSDSFQIERDNFSIVKDNFKIEMGNFKIPTDSFFRYLIKS
jgi:hypothetical protein